LSATPDKTCPKALHFRYNINGVRAEWHLNKELTIDIK
jgi:hypothetical protein